MSDKEFEKLKATVQGYFLKWRTLLGLCQWDIIVYYEREASPDDGTRSTGAINTSSYPYKQAEITFYLPVLKEWGKARTEKAVIHELTHLLVAEMRDCDKDLNHEERVVTDLTNAFKWTYERRQT